MESEAGNRAARTEEREEDPQESSRLVRLSPALIALGGAGASALLCWSLWRSERATADMRLGRDAAHRIAEVRRALEATLDQLRSTAALFESSDVVEPHELDQFTRRGFERLPALRAVLWVESRGGAPPFVLRQAVGPENARFPVGVELDSAAEPAATLAATRQRGELTVSALLVTSGSSDAARVLAAIPFLPEDGRAQGFVCALLDPAPLLSAEDPAEDGRFALRLEDMGGGAALRLAGASGAGPARDEKELEVGGRRWLVSCFDAAVSTAGRAWLPWLALLLGLAGTGLCSATVAGATSRARIQRLVRERTSEVRHAYDTLALEAQERMAAMASARRAERRLRAIIDLVPQLILVRDWLGRIRLANRAAAEAHGTTLDELLMSRRRLQTDEDESVTQEEERALMVEKRTAVVPELRVVDARGRRRVLRETRIPCGVFGDDEHTLLCVATDVSELKRTEDLLRVQNRLLRELARGDNPEKVLVETVLAAEELVPGMRCSVLLLSADGKHLTHGYAPHLPDAYNQAVNGLEIGPDVGSCGAAAFRNARVVVEDVNTHPNWASFRAQAARAGLRACWSHPIRSADDQVLGTFAMYYAEPRKPEPFEERLIESLAYLAGIAIERARLEARS